MPSDQYEVIVSDDGQEYAAEVFCRQHYPWASYTRGPRKGPAANRNCGAKIAAGDWLVFTDDDCLPDAGWLHAYANAIHQYPECNAFEGAILPDDWNLLKKDMAECPVNTGGGCFWSANIMVNKDLFLNVDGFDEQFTLAAQEDQDIKNRLERLTAIAFIPECFVTHPVRIIDFPKKMKRLNASWENWMKYVRKQDPDLQQILIRRSISMHISMALKGVTKLNFKNAIFHTSAGLQYFKLINQKH